MEVWKDISGYEGHYQVSNCGRIKSLKYGKETIMSEKLNSMGYVDIIFTKSNEQKSIRVHRIVAEAFLDNSQGYPVINHIDGDKKNNHIDNLEWCTYSHNNKQAYLQGQNKTKPIIQLTLDGVFIKEWNSMKEASEAVGAHSSNIRKCIQQKIKTAGGFLWIDKV